VSLATETERGSATESQSFIDKLHLGFLRRKRAKRERELASAPAFTPTAHKKAQLGKLDAAIANALGCSSENEREAKRLSALFAGLVKLEQQTGIVKSADFSEAYVIAEGARLGGVSTAWANSLPIGTKQRMRRLV